MEFINEKTRKIRTSTMKKLLEDKRFASNVEQIVSTGETWISYSSLHLSEDIIGTIDEARIFITYFTKVKVEAYKGSEKDPDQLVYILTSGRNALFIFDKRNFDDVYPPKINNLNVKGIDSEKVEMFISEIESFLSSTKRREGIEAKWKENIDYLKDVPLEEYINRFNIVVRVKKTRKYIKVLFNTYCVLFIGEGNIIYRSKNRNSPDKQFYSPTIDEILKTGIKFDNYIHPRYLVNKPEK